LGKILLRSNKFFHAKEWGIRHFSAKAMLADLDSIDPYCLAIATLSATESEEAGKAGQFDKRAAGCIYEDECGCNHVLANKNCLQTTPEALCT
jgi:hypothetical protein